MVWQVSARYGNAEQGKVWRGAVWQVMARELLAFRSLLAHLRRRAGAMCHTSATAATEGRCVAPLAIWRQVYLVQPVKGVAVRQIMCAARLSSGYSLSFCHFPDHRWEAVFSLAILLAFCACAHKRSQDRGVSKSFVYCSLVSQKEPSIFC